MQAFAENWEKVNQEMAEKFEEMRNNLKGKHSEELEKLHEELEKSIPDKPKPSAAYLNSKKIQQNLAKQMKYFRKYQ